MLQNYLKIAFRNLLKNKVYSFINIMGLAAGMAVATLIGLWIWDELSFNKSFKNYSKLGQVQLYQTFNGQRGPQSAIPLPLAKALKNYPDLKEVALASWDFEHIVAVNDNKFTKQGLYTEPNLPKMFSLDMLNGTQNGLQDINVIMISESLAKSLFGSTDVVGKVIKLDNKANMSVTGVFRDFPYNTQFRNISFFLPWKYYLSEQDWVRNSESIWDNNSWQCFVQLNEGAKFESASAKFKDLVLQNMPKENRSLNPEVFIHPMSKWQLYSDVKNGKYEGGRITFVWLFGIIGVFVLLLACINFMNLSTARSEKRAKEVGIRKAVGSVRGQLVNQFLSESVLTVVLAFIVSILLVVLSISWFNELANKKMVLPYTNVYFWGIGLVFILITGLLAGSYPALYLSSFEPVRVLKGTFRVGRFAAVPRKVLVVIQFTVSVTLIIGTVIIYRQIQFAKDRPVGYDRNGLIYIMMNTPELYNAKYQTVRNDLLNTGVVEEVSTSTSPVTQSWSNSVGFEWEGKDPNAKPLFTTIVTSFNYGKTVGMEIIKGRDFSSEFKTDTAGVIINEAAAKVLGFENPIGKFIKWTGNDGRSLQIIGVAKNMIMESPFTPTRPAFYFLNNSWASLYNVKIKNSANVSSAIDKIGAVFKKYNPGSPFDYKFVDEDYNDKFAAESRIGKLATFFAILAIFISCLGLFGLASFVAEQRTKEIGVRKVLGASVFNLWQLLSKDFVYLVLISCVVAIPIAYYYLSSWLEKYEYRTEISWWIFAMAALGALSITLLTVSYQAIKAALENPVKSLKTE
ncbi:MAG: ABC transporter permease [Spirosomaceae bacterium]|jgi:predicted permease|nr:ABC transporter permease [Spirosomataceae bacterium]